ncbi:MULTISPECIES: NRDE family protein [unclassified Nocardia]|uniref:NRDE family protein n=1 Tax=unclassified Nocardia TaxID=2637762 RepID=UPI001CE41B4A|nr:MULTISPECIES: NRDE family protein [unclassified Nocardia]
MCLVLLGWQMHPVYSLVVAANRDEFYRMPTEPMAWRSMGGARLLCGLDVRSGGTWMGMNTAGRLGVVTNVRRGRPIHGSATPSRGLLVPKFAAGGTTPAEFAEQAVHDGPRFGGFNLLIGDRDELWWTSNRSGGRIEALAPGVHGLSNAALDTGWPKVSSGTAEFAKVLDADDGTDTWIGSYLDVLADRRMAPRRALPDTGVGLVLEKLLSARFVRMGVYGTRSSTVLRIRRDGRFDMTERRFDRFGRRVGEITEFGMIVPS